MELCIQGSTGVHNYSNMYIHMFLVPELENLGGEVFLPGIELNDTDPSQHLTDHLHRHGHRERETRVSQPTQTYATKA